MDQIKGNFTELEYKYNADGKKFSEFEAMIEGLKEKYGYKKVQEVNSWDLYYERKEDDFQRLRLGDTPELTRKFKVQESNNWERVEIDLPVRVPEKGKLENIVTKYIGIDGYKFKRKINKTCSIHWFELVNYVYYTVYDSELHELGRFIEIEINKDKVNELGDKAMDLLKEHEKNLAVLGITPQNRMKKSLYETFIKGYAE